MVKKEKFSWEEFDEACRLLAKHLKKQKWFKKIKYIYGIPKGGLPLAVKLAHLLKLHLVVDVWGSEYDIKNTLVVDEVADTGKTLIEKDLVKYRIATIHYKPWSKVKPDVYVFETEEWIIYPWEE